MQNTSLITNNKVNKGHIFYYKANDFFKTTAGDSGPLNSELKHNVTYRYTLELGVAKTTVHKRILAFTVGVHVLAESSRPLTA